MSKAFEFAEMVNQTNYAEMSYNELVTLNFAFLLAEGEIKPLIDKKRAEEMERHTDAFVALMDNYGASKAEILALIEKRAMREKPYGPTPSPDVDDQTPTMDADNNQDKGESVLALPEHIQTPSEEVIETLPMERPAEKAISNQADDVSDVKIDHKKFVKKAIKMSQERPVFEDIDINAPYFVQFNYHIKNEEIKYHSGRGRNLCVEDLDALRLAAEKYVKYFLKGKVAESTEDRLIYWTDNDSTIVVRLYHFPEQIIDGERNQVSIPRAGNSCIPEDELINLRTKHACLKNAIARAKVYSASLGTGFYSPCYDRFTFRDHGYSKAEYRTGPIRIQEDPATLAEIMTAFETYARLDNERTVVLTQDNGVAALVGDIIYLILFNFPDHKNNSAPAKEKKRKAAKKTMPVTKESTTPTEDPLISKAVEITKALPVGNGADVNAPYFVQCDLSVIKDGDLLQKGKPFIKNMSGEEELSKLRRNHLRFAKTMKARQIEEADNYTAFFWNEGKNLTVYYYNTECTKLAS